MKKILLFTLVSLFAIFITTSCTKDCKKCRYVKTNDVNGNVVDEGSSSEYCDTQLDEKENETPSTVGDYTTKWVCE